MNCRPGRHENQWTVRHRALGTPEYKSWSAMRTRCLTPTSKDFPRYGGAGISICDRWEYFDAFLEDMGSRPEGTTLDRIDPTRGYSPDNCRWATPTEQTRNRRNAINVEYLGEVKSLKQWCEQFGVNYFTAHRKLRRESKTAAQIFGGAL